MGFFINAKYLPLSSNATIYCILHLRRFRLYAQQSGSIGMLVVQAAPGFSSVVRQMPW
jgi:hypothetical protein